VSPRWAVSRGVKEGRSSTAGIIAKNKVVQYKQLIVAKKVEGGGEQRLYRSCQDALVTSSVCVWCIRFESI
jgi:hypothetical protein